MAYREASVEAIHADTWLLANHLRLGQRARRDVSLDVAAGDFVAIARALVNGPAIILADEPTRNLDSRSSVEIMAILHRLKELGMTIVMVTHERDIARFCKRIVRFRDGRVIEDRVKPSPLVASAVLADLPPEEPEEGIG